MKKLNLNKKTISELSDAQLNEVKGGFTYSLSLGARCKYSKSQGAKSQYECGYKNWPQWGSTNDPSLQDG